MLGSLLGCEGKVIENLGAIDARAELRADGVWVEIFLLTEDGERLYWTSDLLSPHGAGVLAPEDLDTHVEIWSLRNGERNRKVYSGRLQGLHWNTIYVNAYRSLIGRVPSYAIERDPEADAPVGEMEIALITPRQGTFRVTLSNVPIYPPGRFPSGGTADE
ncbi:MAG: hypothetical protein KatS3mg115_1218 [Candidatus Poribacteria bacterium]|nr:MAG: hypothetical protein KatS3mg115_1218 [Candidatus Poribacteria bacterium]